MPTIGEPSEREPYEPDVGAPGDWECIERELGFEDFDPRRREQLWHRLRSPFRVYFKPNEPPDLRVANFTRALKRLERDVEGLRNDLTFSWTDEDDGRLRGIYETAASDEEIEDRVNALSLKRVAKYTTRAPFANFNDNEAFAWSVDKLLPEGERVALVTILDKLMADVDTHRQQLGKEKGGQRQDWRFDMTIDALARIYHDITRRAPGVSRIQTRPGGPFFRFVKASFQVFAPDRLSGDEALVKRISKVLREKRRRAAHSN